MKGIILAGGSGTRLYPLTITVSKQLLSIYDKPMIYYPLSVLMLAGINDILIISTPHDLPAFKRLFGSGRELGLSISYQEQTAPRGLAEALILGESFLNGESSCLILGDNIFFGHNFSEFLSKARRKIDNEEGAMIIGYQVKDPERYGILEFSAKNEIISIEEKPQNPKSNYAVVGLYFYDAQAPNLAKKLTPSNRGELEITDLHKLYLSQGQLSFLNMGRGFAWLDTGTPESLADATSFVRTLEERQGVKIACLEEISFNKGWINLELLKNQARKFENSLYGKYLWQICASYENLGFHGK